MTKKKADHPDDAEPGRWLRQGAPALSRAQVAASLIMTILLVAAGLFILHDFLPALLWAVILAIAIWPWFARLGRHMPNHRRELLPMLMVLGVALVFVVPVVLVAVPLARDSHAVFMWVRQARENGIPPPDFLQHLPFADTVTATWQRELGNPQGIQSLVGNAMQGRGADARREIGDVVHRLVLFGFSLVTLFFLLRDGEALTRQLLLASRRAFGDAGEQIGRQMVRSVHGTVDGLVLVGLGEGALMGIAYAVAGVPHPALFGLLTALLAMIPFGAAIAFGIAALALLATGSIVAAVSILVLGFVVSFAADHFVRPQLIGGATRLPFLWVLFGILGGVGAFGLLGLFVGPAVMAALMLLWREWVGAAPGPINPTAAEVAPALAGSAQLIERSDAHRVG